MTAGMSWVPIPVSLIADPRLDLVARRLGIAGPQALGHLVRLLLAAGAYAADGRPLGADEVEAAAGWNGAGEGLVEALLAVGLLEHGAGGLVIAGWAGLAANWHRQQAERARDRARKRAGAPTELPRNSGGTPAEGDRNSKEFRPYRREEKKTEDHSLVEDHAPAPPAPGRPTLKLTPVEPLASEASPEAVAKAWNTIAGAAGLPKVATMTKQRRRALAARIAEDHARRSIDWWAGTFARVVEAPFLAGEGPRGWRATLDFVLKGDALTRIQEGVFDGASAQAQTRRPSPPAGIDFSAAARARAEGGAP